jgi:hypothetical protein
MEDERHDRDIEQFVAKGKQLRVHYSRGPITNSPCDPQHVFRPIHRDDSRLRARRLQIA